MLSRQATPSKLFLPPFWKGIYSTKNSCSPFQKGPCVEESKQEVIKVVSLVKMVKMYQVYPSTLCMLGNFACFFFSPPVDWKKKSFRNTISVSNNVDPGQARHYRAWSGSKLFAKVISRQQESPQAEKEFKRNGYYKWHNCIIYLSYACIVVTVWKQI